VLSGVLVVELDFWSKASASLILDGDMGSTPGRCRSFESNPMPDTATRRTALPFCD
jgi:hypothetical protein